MTDNITLARAAAHAASQQNVDHLLNAIDLATGELRIRQERLSLNARIAGFLEADLLPPEVDRDIKRLQETTLAIAGLAVIKRALEKAAEE